MALYNYNASCTSFNTDDVIEMANTIYDAIRDNMLNRSYNIADFYKKAINVYLTKRCISVQINKQVPVLFEDEIIGFDTVDFIINNDIIVLIESLSYITEAQVKELMKKMNCSTVCVITRDVICSTQNYDTKKSEQSTPLVKVFTR